MKLKSYCVSTIYRKLLDSLPNYISPLGVGKNLFPSNWLDEKKGKNISNLNQYYGEHSGIYWVWQNCMDGFKENDWIGFCHYRKLWLNDLYEKKQKLNIGSLYSNLLKENNDIFKKNEVILIQPIIYQNKNLFQDFEDVHKTNILRESLSFFDINIKNSFENHLNSNSLYPLNLFIVKKNIFIKYCETIFPWLEKCFELCKKKNLLKDYNTRLPSFLSERFVSFWFSQYENKAFLSYAKLGKAYLSNFTNKFFNPIKLPFTFRNYPTIHKY